MLKETSHCLAHISKGQKNVGTPLHSPKQHKAEADRRAQLLVAIKAVTNEILKNAEKATQISGNFVSESSYFSRKILTCDGFLNDNFK